MKLVQTLYLNQSANPFRDGLGWAAPEYHLMSWALSYLQLSKFYNKVDLYVNSAAARLLIDILKLPYNQVNLKHDHFSIVDNRLWALPKIFTYSLQEEPFLHVDGDVFIFDKLSSSLLSQPLIAQNIEQATEYYQSTQREIMKHFTYFPKCVKKDFNRPEPIHAVNAGIMGGSDIDFFRRYTKAAFTYVDKNSSKLPSINVDRFNVFFEQHLFYSLATEMKRPVSFLFNDVVNDNEYTDLGNIYTASCPGNYFHLLGHFKRDEFTCTQMAAKLRSLYPDYYYHIISLCKRKKIPLRLISYYGNNLKKKTDFISFTSRAKNQYLKGLLLKDSKDAITKTIKNPAHALLKKALSLYMETCMDENTNKQVRMDFNAFNSGLNAFLKKSYMICPDYLYGRDLLSLNQYCDLFKDESVLHDKHIVTCKEVHVIDSRFDWAGVFNKFTRTGVRYYEELVLSEGCYYNLIVPELTSNKVSLFDLDEFEKIILERSIEPISIRELLIKMRAHVDDEVIEYHLGTFENLIISFLKQLVIKKAIKQHF